MERFSSTTKQRGYNRNYHNVATNDGATSSSSKRKNIKVVRFGDKNSGISSPLRDWKIKTPTTNGSKASPEIESSSRSNVWKKVKNGCSKMMLNLAGNGDGKHGDHKAIPASEFDNRIVLEIYKSIGATS